MIVLAYVRWFIKINQVVGNAFRVLLRFLTNSKTCRVAETFLNEAAVLWFVFPILDEIYQHKKLTDPILRQANLAAAVFFLGAVALSHIGKEN